MNKWRFAFLTPAGVALAFMLHYSTSGFSQPVLQFWIAITARLAFLLFFMAFAASGLNRFFRSGFTKLILTNRSQIGVAFALTHLFHFGLVAYKDLAVDPVFAKRTIGSLIPGTVVYIFIVLMLLTSFDYFKRKLSPKSWSFIHTVGGYLILFLFTGAYFKRMHDPIFWPLVALAIGIWVIRLLNLKKPVVKTT